MRVVIKKIGPIEHFDIDLAKPLTVVYGMNNIGKSYGMQIAYLLAKYTVVEAKYGYIQFRMSKTKRMNKWKEVITQFIDDGNEERDITSDVFDEISNAYTMYVVSPLIDAVQNTFSTYESMISEESVLEITNAEYIITINVKKGEAVVKENTEKNKGKPTFLKKTTSGFHKSRESKYKLDIYVLVEREGQYDIKNALYTVETVIDKAIDNFFLSICREVGDLYYLPASRSGMMLGMSAMNQGLILMGQNRNRMRGSVRITNIPEPVADYYYAISEIYPQRMGRYSGAAAKIEKEILGGEVLYDNQQKVLKYKQDGSDEVLEMTDASSMVAEISPITAFLKYVIIDEFRVRRHVNSDKQKTILFIEEPEAHLHPENQVKLIDYIQEMLDKRISLVISSHSNYILNKLNNMVLKKRLDSNNYDAIIMEKSKEGYGRTRVMPGDQYGYEDVNFMDTADELYEEREQVIMKIINKEDE